MRFFAHGFCYNTDVTDRRSDKMDYILNVFRNKEFLFAIGRKHMNYDNVIWWQLEELINVVSENENTPKEELVNKIQNKCVYFQFVMNEEQTGEPVLDLSNKTIEINHMNLYNLDDVTYSEVGRNLIQIEEELKIKYECDEEIFDLKYVESDLELLSKKIMTFDEALKVSKFINGLIETYESDFIVNNEKALILFYA